MSRTNYPCSIFLIVKILVCSAGLVAIIFFAKHLIYGTKPVMTDQKENKVAYLTFDDGPSWVTAKVLDVLEEKNVKATFFVIGNEITGDKEDLIKKMAKDGHVIGIHTYCHKKDEIYCSKDALFTDIKKTYDRIYEITGIKPVLYRFPWGSINCYMNNDICEETEQRISDMGITYNDWNVSGEDSVGTPTTYSIIHSIEKNFKRYDEPVILLHDSKINELTSQVLPQIIDMIEEEGYTFDTLDHRSKPCQYNR